jgi:iron(III) transport system ATP-binding protein
VLKDSGAASVVVTHDPEEAMLLGDRVAVMRAGRILQIGTPDAVYRRPETPFVAEFLGEVNKFRGAVNGAGAVDTPLGPVAAPGLAPGAPAIVIIRQQGVRVFPGTSAPGVGRAEPAQVGVAVPAVPVVVAWVRPMGAASLVLLRRRGAGGKDPPIYARVSGRLGLAEGALAQAGIDGDEVFVFPAETPKSEA